MAAANTNIITLLAVILLWAGLAIWRDAVVEKLHRIEVSNVQFYLDVAARTGERPPPVRLGDRIIVPPASESTRTVQWNEPYIGVANKAESLWLGGGWLLSRVPAVIFHGAFAFASIALTVSGLQ